MTEVSRLSKFAHKVGNILDKTALPDVSRDAEQVAHHEQTPIPGVLADLISEADGFLKNGQPLDDAWMGSASTFLVRAISDGDAHGVITAQEVFRRLSNTVHRSAAAAPNAGTGIPTTGGSAYSHVAPQEDLSAREVLAQVNALINIADAGAGIVRPKSLAFQLEPGALPARILLSLSQLEVTYTEDLRERLSAGVTQLSRACNKLADRGLVTRRSHGRRAAWSLTNAGAATAETLRRMESGGKVKDGDATVATVATVATTIQEFLTAVHQRASHIALGFAKDVASHQTGQTAAAAGRKTQPSCHYLLTSAVAADEITGGLDRLPAVVLTEDPNSAYVISDWPGCVSDARHTS